MNLLFIPLFARGERKTHAIFMQFSDLQFLEEWIKSEKKEVKIRAWTWHLLIREVETIDKPPKETATKVGNRERNLEWPFELNRISTAQPKNTSLKGKLKKSLSETWIKVMLCLLAWKIWLKISVGFEKKESQITFIEAALFEIGICSIGLRLQHATDKFSILLHHVLSDAILGLCFITMFKKSFRFQASLAALYLYSTNLTFPLIPALKLNVANILYSYYTPKSIGNIA